MQRPYHDPELLDRLHQSASRRSISVAHCASQAQDWVSRWWDEAVVGLEDPPPVRSRVVDNAAHYAVWHEVGPTSGDQPGFLALNRLAIREARSIDRGTEAANETWLDVRDRLEQTVSRAAAGKSIPDFSGPRAEGEDNTHRYHGIQARLRVAGKWSRTRATELYEEGRHSADWAGAFRAAEARTYALPLHFAAWWTLLDVKSRTTRDGRVKGAAWWWSMLLHALDLEKIDALGGDRNDPTEALLRMRLRFSVAQGLAGWLRRWAAVHPYWSQVEFGLPDPNNAVARSAAEEALQTVLPALISAIDEIDVTPGERKALMGTLTRGENVRTSTRGVSGDDATARQGRLFALGQHVGRLAGDRLGGGGSTGEGGGGAGGHRHVAELMARVASGAVPDPMEVHSLTKAVAECETCRDQWAGWVDLEPYAGAAAAEAPRRGWGRLGLGILAMASALVLVPLAMPDRSTVVLRGSEGTVGAHLDLFVASGGAVERLGSDEPVRVGDQMVFRVSSDQPSRVGVWVNGPEGAGEIGWQSAGPDPVTLGDSYGKTATTYRFERPGRYVFTASTVQVGPEGICEPPACVRTVVEVRP